ncbi:MAG TPA: AraC family transcriptional regulator [Brevundimonas sp.]|uniref:AraC family transcriptional regulator n=1 Tax=Brevundimonas sp. TaxID=1871086 RepID=UPI002DE727F2|nr:AraC family transcriptional regulator [Brevundimonas sp.]
MMTAALDHYRARMIRVLDHIDRRLDDDLDLETVSGVAAFSKFHFHRQFAATFGLSLHRYVQLARLRRASRRLEAGDGSVTDIAMEAGYETPDAFARAFRQRFNQSPSRFRKSPDWASWLQALGPMNAARSKLMPMTYDAAAVTIREVDPVRVALFEHRGDPSSIDATIQRFIAWRKTMGLSPRTSPTFNIWHSERRPADPADYRMDLCVGVGPDRQVEGDGVREGQIPGGRCAVLRVTGDTHNLEPAAQFLYREWLPGSGEEMRDFPIYCQRLFLDEPERGAAADLFLPLR